MSTPTSVYPGYIDSTLGEHRRETQECYDALNENERGTLQRCSERITALAKQQGFGIESAYFGFTLLPEKNDTAIYVGPRTQQHGARMNGLLEGLGLAGNGRQPVKFFQNVNYPIGAVKFASINELAMALNAATKTQDEKINIGTAQQR